jgi:hypothetical protein
MKLLTPHIFLYLALYFLYFLLSTASSFGSAASPTAIRSHQLSKCLLSGSCTPMSIVLLIVKHL